MPDHVDMLVMISPKYLVSVFIGCLKGKMSLMIFEKHPTIKYLFENRYFGAKEYYGSTVGLNEDTMRKYIRGQETVDIVPDKLSVKEDKAPFRSSK